MTQNALKKGLMIAVLVVLAVSAAWANGSSDGQDSGEKEITMIHFMSPAQDDANSKAFAATMSAYRENHPDVTVSDEFIQHDNYEMKLKTMAATQSLPDLYYSKPDLFPLLRENDLLASVDGILDADPAFASVYKAGAFNDFIQEGETWAFPFQLQSNHVVYYNKDLLARAGYSEFPKTMDEFVQACSDLDAMGVVPFVIGNKGKWLVPSCIFNTMVYRYTDADWFNSLYNSTGARFTDAPFVDAARKLVELREAGAFNDDLNSIDNNQQRTVFYSGEAAMFVEGSWALGPVIENATEDFKSKVGLAVLPPVEGHEDLANIVAGGAGWGICINGGIDADQDALVTEYIKEVYGQNFADLSAQNGGFPAIVPEIDASELDELQAAYNQLPLEFAPIFDVQLSSTIVDVFYNDLQKLLMGSLTPEEYASNVEAVR